tara:strand:+ start:594 stop:776 length:183 start_codon:yes stop_codon:yes gene_type:complete
MPGLLSWVRLFWTYRKAIGPLLMLLGETVTAIQDGNLSSQERNAVLRRFWAVVGAASGEK